MRKLAIAFDLIQSVPCTRGVSVCPEPNSEPGSHHVGIEAVEAGLQVDIGLNYSKNQLHIQYQYMDLDILHFDIPILKDNLGFDKVWNIVHLYRLDYLDIHLAYTPEYIPHLDTHTLHCIN